MPLSAQLALSFLSHESSSGDLARTMRVTPATYALALSDGSGANKAQVAWSDARTLSGASDTLNLASLADTRDGAAAVVTITAAKAIYVKNTHSSISLAFSGGPLTASGVVLASGGVCFLCNASAAGLGAGTISVAGSAGATYEIVIVGEGSVA
jgi:hypothetical protein